MLCYLFICFVFFYVPKVHVSEEQTETEINSALGSHKFCFLYLSVKCEEIFSLGIKSVDIFMSQCRSTHSANGAGV